MHIHVCAYTMCFVYTAIPWGLKLIEGENRVSVKKVIAVAMGFALLAIFGITLTAYILNNKSEFDKCIKIDNGTTELTEQLELKAEGLAPGDNVEYTISFDISINDAYKMTLAFEETAGEKFKDFLDVEIGIKGDERETSENDVKFTGTMSELFQAKTVHLGDKVSTSSTIYVKFSVGIDVGLEDIGGKFVDFNSELKVEKM